MLGEPSKNKDYGTVELGDITALFRENLGKIILCGVVAVAGMLVYLDRTPAIYSSTAVLEVAPDLKAPAATQSDDESDSTDTLKTIELEITNPSVLVAVARDRDLAHDPDFTGGRPVRTIDEAALRLRRRIDVELVRGSRLLTVTADDRDPVKAQALASAVLDEFFRQSLASQQANSVGNHNLLLAEAKRVGDELRASEERLEDYREKHQAISLADRQDIVVERLRDLNQRVAAAKNARIALEAERDEIRRLSGPDPEQLLSLDGIANAPEVIDLRRQVALQAATVATLSQRYGPLHPTLIQAKSELANLHGSLDQAVRRAGARMEQSYAAALETENALNQALSDQERKATALNRTAIPYHSLEREVQANATMYQKILDNLRQMDLTHRLLTPNEVEGTDIRVLAAPLVPDHPSRPRRKLLLALAAAAGLFLGSGGVVLRRALDQTLTSVDEAETSLGLPVLVTVPLSRERRLRARPEVVRRPASAQAEAFRSLRTALSLLPEGGEYRTILFTSAIPGEGKSTCSLNFAAALAQQGCRTLLIDADLRRPSLHRLFPIDAKHPGLTECLRDPSLFSAAVGPTAIDGLYRLGDRQGRAAGAELLAAGRGIREILAQARNSFERIVIDTAPLLAVGDTLRIARDVEAVCLVVDARRTPGRLVRRAIKLLEDVARRRPTGIILNRICRRGAARRYYHYEATYGSA